MIVQGFSDANGSSLRMRDFLSLAIIGLKEVYAQAIKTSNRRKAPGFQIRKDKVSVDGEKRVAGKIPKAAIKRNV